MTLFHLRQLMNKEQIWKMGSIWSQVEKRSSMDSEDEEDLMIVTTVAVIEKYYMTYIYKEPCRTSILSGNVFVTEVLAGHPNRCYEMFRMNKDVFKKLCQDLRERKLLENMKRMSIEEQLAIFLSDVGQNKTNREMQERFQHSGETISRHFNNVLKAIIKPGREIIVPPSFSSTPPEISSNPKYYPWFKDCIGALDGTHIDAIVPTENQIPYRNRKWTLSQNVMAECSFDMKFIYVLSGWEGSANDSRILQETINNRKFKFPALPPGKYFVVDAGYPNRKEFLAPYKGERYHLQDYRGGRKPTNARELFNYGHSSLRNVIERCFSVLKMRFPILKMMHGYHLNVQTYIVVATCTLLNYIRQSEQDDKLFDEYEDENSVHDNGDEDNNHDSQIPGFDLNQEYDMDLFRDTLASSMYNAFINGGAAIYQN